MFKTYFAAILFVFRCEALPGSQSYCGVSSPCGRQFNHLCKCDDIQRMEFVDNNGQQNALSLCYGCVGTGVQTTITCDYFSSQSLQDFCRATLDSCQKVSYYRCNCEEPVAITTTAAVDAVPPATEVIIIIPTGY